MYRKSLYADKAKFTAALKAVESQIVSGRTLEEIPASLSADFQEREITRLLGSIASLKQLNKKSKVHLFLQITLAIFILIVLMNTAFLYMAISGGNENNLDLSQNGMSQTTLFLLSISTLLIYTFILFTTFRESYKGLILSQIGLILTMPLIMDIFVIFEETFLLYLLPSLLYIVILSAQTFLIAKQKRFELLYLKEQLLKQGIDIERLLERMSAQ